MLKGMGGLGDMAKMMKAAQEMQGKVAEVQESLNAIKVTGESGAGLVKATATAKGELVGLEITAFDRARAAEAAAARTCSWARSSPWARSTARSEAASTLSRSQSCSL